MTVYNVTKKCNGTKTVVSTHYEKNEADSAVALQKSLNRFAVKLGSVEFTVESVDGSYLA